MQNQSQLLHVPKRTRCSRLASFPYTMGLALLCALFVLANAPSAPAQGTPQDDAAERIIMVMSGYHGFDQNQLEEAAQGEDVSAILRGIIDDPNTSSRIRRQAFKALGLFPTNENFTYFQGKLAVEPSERMQRLILVTLGAFHVDQGEALKRTVGNYLAHPSSAMRHAALSLASQLPPEDGVKHILQARLYDEGDESVAEAIRAQLQ